MKIVITGGAGFIGSHLAEFWSQMGNEVVVLDNLRSGFTENIENINNVELVNASITDRKQVFNVLEGADYVFNLAAMISVPESIEKPEECVNINVLGLLNVLDAAKKHKVKKVVHSSSAAVYGDDPVLPKKVDMRPKPLSPYGITKLDGEYYLQMYKDQYNLNTTSLRYFNVFGPRQDPKSQYAAAVPIFIYKALKNDTITIYGDGEQTRDFIFVKDVVKANVLAAKKENISGVFNVANEQTISIKQLANKIIELTNSRSRIVFEAERPGDIKHSYASIKETREVFGFEPQHNIDSALIETINFFKTKL